MKTETLACASHALATHLAKLRRQVRQDKTQALAPTVKLYERALDDVQQRLDILATQ